MVVIKALAERRDGLSPFERGYATALHDHSDMSNRQIAAEINKLRVKSDPSAKGPHYSSVNRVLNNQTFQAPAEGSQPRGRPRATTATADARLVGVVDRLQKELEGEEVTARRILDEWKPENSDGQVADIHPQLVSRRLRALQYRWRPTRRCLTLTFPGGRGPWRWWRWWWVDFPRVPYIKLARFVTSAVHA